MNLFGGEGRGGEGRGGEGRREGWWGGREAGWGGRGRGGRERTINLSDRYVQYQSNDTTIFK